MELLYSPLSRVTGGDPSTHHSLHNLAQSTIETVVAEHRGNTTSQGGFSWSTHNG